MKKSILLLSAVLPFAALQAQDFAVPLDPPFEENYHVVKEEAYYLPSEFPLDSLTQFDKIELREHRLEEHVVSYMDEQFASYSLIETLDDTYRNKWDYKIAKTLITPTAVKQYNKHGDILNQLNITDSLITKNQELSNALAQEGLTPMLPIPSFENMTAELSAYSDMEISALSNGKYQVSSGSETITFDPVNQVIMAERTEVPNQETPVLEVSEYQKTQQGFLIPVQEVKQYRYYSEKGYPYTRQVTQNYDYAKSYYRPDALSESALEYLNHNPFHAYPNPVNGEFSIQYAGAVSPAPFQFEIYDAYGNLIMPLTDMVSSQTVSADSWQPGIYIVIINYQNQVYQLKIQKQ